MTDSASLLEFREGRATEQEIFEFLNKCDSSFMPPLSSRVNIQEYSKKIFENAVNFEAWDKGSLIGLISSYYNDQRGETGFISNVCVMPQYQGLGVANELLSLCLSYGRLAKFKMLRLEVALANNKAQNFYKKAGFVVTETTDKTQQMELNLG